MNADIPIAGRHIHTLGRLYTHSYVQYFHLIILVCVCHVHIQA